MIFLDTELEELKGLGLYRKLRTIENAQGPRVRVRESNGDAKELLCFCSNNYLGLANHPKVEQAAAEAIQRYGWGAGASRLISGNMAAHDALEQRLADFKRAEAAIVFPTGYMANLGAITALVGRGDLVIGDKLNHASIIDACRLSGARFRIYPHRDTRKLERLLSKTIEHRRALIVTDTLFSMDGDLAPLPDIVALAKRHGAMTMVDEAHATGVFGENGRGVLERFGLDGEVDVVMGTLSKAIGGLGGFIVGKRKLIAYLRNKARSFIYTTALPPATCAAAVAGIEIIEEQPSLRQKLWQNVEYVTKRLRGSGYDLASTESQIIPIIVGDAMKAAHISEWLCGKGLLIPAVRPPTVPQGASRLRLSLMATHTRDDLDLLLKALAEAKEVFKKR